MVPLVRAAGGADLATINEIYNDAVLNTTSTFDVEARGIEEARAWLQAHGPTYPVFVAERDGRVAGWSSLSPFAPRPAYRYTVEDSVYVHRDHRGEGIGGVLLAALLTAAAALGYRAVVARIADHNEASLRLHRRAGFTVVGTLTAIGWKFGRWIDVDLLELVLPERAGRL